MNCSDWNLFWTAFGAIGTTLGSFITAIAVVVAVRQYQEPLVKRLKIGFSFAFPVYSDNHLGADLFCISVANTGVRPINVSNIYLNVGKKNLILNDAQFVVPGAMPLLSFPAEIQPEQKVQMYLEVSKFSKIFKEMLKGNEFGKSEKVKVAVTDLTDEWHYHFTGYTAGEMANL
ncbi:MAG: hypothetical protein HFF04_08290 [Oscillospiraceae bacterium]|nr:hypothetical protein [Oscillospiraceae bacterium]